MKIKIKFKIKIYFLLEYSALTCFDMDHKCSLYPSTYCSTLTISNVPISQLCAQTCNLCSGLRRN